MLNLRTAPSLWSSLDTDLEARLQTAIDTGELKPGTDPATLAVLASSLLHSISVRARAGKSREQLTGLVHNAVNVIAGERGHGRT